MGKKKIIVADDEPSVRLTIRKMLGNDHIIIEATNGEEALNITKEQMPDLVLMDLMMPKMDGYIACNKIKRDEDTREIPVVMLTGIDHELNKKFANEMGADGYITKPFTLQKLLDVVKKFL